MKKQQPHWRFWIDVGGTFTDCVAVAPNGQISQSKSLSSGVVKGRIGNWVGGMAFTAAANTASNNWTTDRQDFWVGYDCRLIDDQGTVLLQRKLTASSNATFTLGGAPLTRGETQAGVAFELSHGDEAPLLAIRRQLQIPLSESLPTVDVRLGTTRGTNALLTRSGARTALAITKGFADLPLIGNQDRPRLFDLQIVKPQPLHTGVCEVSERIDCQGDVLETLDEQLLQDELTLLRNEGFESLAICFLNAYRNPQHERRAEIVAKRVGFEFVTLSHQVSPLIKLVSRTDTSIVDAYLNPILRQYVDRLENSLSTRPNTSSGNDGASRLRLLSSSGGLLNGAAFSGKDSILSGPAGGAVGFSRAAEAAGFANAIGFDMGGTSTDVSRFSGRLERKQETVKAGVRIVAPMLAIETIAAGGGSICQFDGSRLTVGPASAGADPGPACYGRGGPLAVTDMNYWLGRLPTDQFPFALDRKAVQNKLTSLCENIQQQSNVRYSPEELAAGFLKVANANMARAIRAISLEQGYDPKDYVLAAFGGAAPQHACAVADEIGMRSILIHPMAGVLSAWGAGMADIVQHAEAAVYQAASEFDEPRRQQLAKKLAQQASEAALAEGASPNRLETYAWINVRYQGVDAEISLPLHAPTQEGDTLASRFERLHRQRYGYAQSGRPLEIVSIRVEAIGRSDQTASESKALERTQTAQPHSKTKAFFQDGYRDTPHFRRDQMAPGEQLCGPAIISDAASTIVVEPNWDAQVLSEGELLLSRLQPLAKSNRASFDKGSHADPIRLEVFNNRFAAIAEQMGIALRNTSVSVNVKERLDFSCALFAPDGGLVVNAPHIPVHLGAMSETIRCVLQDHELRPEDVIVTNDPYRGGSHLPDVTVVTPVFENATGGAQRLLFLTASRAHHAEIGGAMPGSMPPFSTHLGEEGVLLESFKVIDAGQPKFDELEHRLCRGEFPSRSPQQNIADINAQIAANQLGAKALRELMQVYSVDVVQSYMQHIRNAAAKKTRAAIANLADGVREFSDRLDCGARIGLKMTVAGEQIQLDFSSTDGVLKSNLNANRAIVSAAIMYCLRCILAEDIPLNEGVLEAVTIVLPTNSLLNPSKAATPQETPAMVGGNVETSQRIVDVLLGAFGVAAASQGSMNNVLFGDESFGYYETICGGVGATPAGRGASGVHTHMTNTRITDPEVFEQRLPARLLEFSIRQGSGGNGLHRGGDGIVRRIQFLKRLELSILSQRRGPYAPYGAQGGQPGQLGRNRLRRSDGNLISLPGIAHQVVDVGDELTIETPGGGGWGNAED